MFNEWVKTGAFTESSKSHQRGRRRHPSVDERDTEQHQSILALQAVMIHSAHGVHRLFLREVRGFRVFLGLGMKGNFHVAGTTATSRTTEGRKI